MKNMDNMNLDKIRFVFMHAYVFYLFQVKIKKKSQ